MKLLSAATLGDAFETSLALLLLLEVGGEGRFPAATIPAAEWCTAAAAACCCSRLIIEAGSTAAPPPPPPYKFIMYAAASADARGSNSMLDIAQPATGATGGRW